jgi:hypothetical protein
MDAKKTYGRPIIDPRAASFKMKYYSDSDIKKYGLNKQIPTSSVIKRASLPYNQTTRSDSLPPN